MLHERTSIHPCTNELHPCTNELHPCNPFIIHPRKASFAHYTIGPRE